MMCVCGYNHKLDISFVGAAHTNIAYRAIISQTWDLSPISQNILNYKMFLAESNWQDTNHLLSKFTTIVLLTLCCYIIHKTEIWREVE